MLSSPSDDNLDKQPSRLSIQMRIPTFRCCQGLADLDACHCNISAERRLPQSIQRLESQLEALFLQQRPKQRSFPEHSRALDGDVRFKRPQELLARPPERVGVALVVFRTQVPCRDSLVKRVLRVSQEQSLLPRKYMRIPCLCKMHAEHGQWVFLVQNSHGFIAQQP